MGGEEEREGRSWEEAGSVVERGEVGTEGKASLAWRSWRAWLHRYELVCIFVELGWIGVCCEVERRVCVDVEGIRTQSGIDHIHLSGSKIVSFRDLCDR